MHALNMHGVLAALIATLCIIVTVAQDANPITVESTKLQGWEGCDDTMQRIITEAWDDAVYLADVAVSNVIDFDEFTARLYLGDPDLNLPKQDAMRRVIKQVFDAGRKWWWNPSFWHVDIRCDDWLKSVQRGCKYSLATAYTNNPGQANKYPTINFCPSFFATKKVSGKVIDKIPTCQYAIERWGKSPVTEYKTDLTNYICKGYVVLHELFHLTEISQAGNQGPIVDYKVKYYDEENQFTGTQNVYGPQMTKVLARWKSPKIGDFVSTSADNLALYVLARFVKLKTRSTPTRPLMNGVPVGEPYRDRKPLFTIQNGMLTVTNNTLLDQDSIGPWTTDAADANNDCDDDSDGQGNDGCSTAPPIVIDSFVDYPPDLQAMIDSQSQGYPDESFGTDSSLGDIGDGGSYVPPDNPFLTCAYSPIANELQGSVSLSTVNPMIADFCSRNADFTLSADSNGNVTWAYPAGDGTNHTVWLAAIYNYGDTGCNTPQKMDKTLCNAQISAAINDCDTSSTTNKYGGYLVNDCVVWGMGVDPEGENWDPAPTAAASTSAPAATSSTASGPPPPYATGWCGIHVIQYRKNEAPPPFSGNADYVIAVSVFDGKQKALTFQDCNGCGTTSETFALSNQPNVFKTVLPYELNVVVGNNDDDPVQFSYNGANWDGNSASHHSSTGGYGNGVRNMDTGFTC